jgi:hypothetical protein
VRQAAKIIAGNCQTAKNVAIYEIDELIEAAEQLSAS